MELGDLKGVGGVTEERLNNAGVTSIDELAQTTIDSLTDEGMSENKAEKIIRRAKENAVIVQSGNEVVEEYESKENITTGMPYLDNLLDGGWQQGNVVAISGETGSGKTQIGFKAMVSAVEATDKPVVYIETERNRYSPKRLTSLSELGEGILSNIYRVKAYDLEQQEMSYAKVRKEFDDCSLVVIDSFTARFRLSDEFSGRDNLPKRSQIMGRHLEQIEKMAAHLDVPVLMTAQIMGNPTPYGSSQSTYGGSLFHHTVNYFIKMKNAQGSFSKATIANHPEIGEVEFHINITENDLEAMEDV
jgi:RecA/RadA recombinase